MRIRRMVRADWQWIAPWFDDDELCHRLGPLDEEWLEHVLAEHEGVQLVVTDIDGAPIGLAGVRGTPGVLRTQSPTWPSVLGVGG